MIYIYLYSNVFTEHRKAGLYSICNFHTSTLRMIQLCEITTLRKLETAVGYISIKISTFQKFLNEAINPLLYRLTLMS